jgi:tetratricopeptide (TPR) repeat protein
MRHILVGALLLCLAMPAVAAEEGSLEWYSQQSKQAISQGNYESAVKLLMEARRKFPSAPALDAALADLFYEKELFALSLDAYRRAEGKGDASLHTLNQISHCLGKLGRDREAIDTLNRILKLFPESVESIDDLGWMYFKTYQLEKGEKILTEGLSRFGMQRGMAMTLGTIYSGMNRYEKSREYYQKAITDALKADDRYFASIAYYNLSLLEHAFFRYNSALRATEDSLAMEDRSSGHLARGELYQSRLDYRGALAEYEKAYALDTTPLTKVNLAILHQRFGHLELARRYAEEALGAKDLAWMLYYGTDVRRHSKDLHEILSRIHRGLAREDVSRPTAGPVERARALYSALRHLVLGWYHTQQYRLLSLDTGRKYRAEGRLEEAYGEFSRAASDYREVAAVYLEKARVLETARTPHAAAFYQQEQGRNQGSAALLRQSLLALDPFWEKEAAADSLRWLAPLLARAGDAAGSRDAIDRLYAANPGALRQHGLGLPLTVAITDSGRGVWEKALIFRYLKRACSALRTEMEGGDARGFAYTLTVRLEPGGRARYRIVEDANGRIVADGDEQLSGSRSSRAARLVQVILDDLYSVQ